jgi:hypothetical protein
MTYGFIPSNLYIKEETATTIAKTKNNITHLVKQTFDFIIRNKIDW